MLSSLNQWRARISCILAGNHSPGSATSILKSRRVQTAGLLIFTLAFTVRLLYLQDNSVEIVNSESIATSLVDDYQQEALRMLEQSYLLFPPQSSIDSRDARMILHPPGYSIILALLYGKDIPNRFYIRLRLLHIVCDSLSAVMIFLIAIQMLPFAVAIIGALLSALSPHLAYYSQWLTPDSVAVLPILLAVYLLIQATQKPRFLTLLVAGISLGLSCWLRANGMLLALFLAIIFLIVCKDRRRWQYAGVFIATVILLIMPITIRNWVTYQHFIPLSLGAGITLIEGIGEYDKEERFGLPADDLETGLKEAEWYGRPEYAEELWRLDGLERDRSRFAKGVAVMKSNPGWFSTIMLRRMAFMLRYNDFRPQNRTFNHTTAPTVLAFPSFNYANSIGDDLEPVFTLSPSAVWSEITDLPASTKVSLLKENDILQVAGDLSGEVNLFAFAPIEVKKYTDYILKIPVQVTQGEALIKVKTTDPRITLSQGRAASANRNKKNKQRKKRENNEENSTEQPPMNFIQVCFTSADTDKIQIVFVNDKAETQALNMQLGTGELFELGATPYQWTRLPRSIIRGIQKNIYKTDLLRLLILLGILLLAFTKQKRILILLLAVPVYYLCLQSTLHTEYRYILAIHYFLFVLAGLTIYFTGVTMMQILRYAKKRF